MSRITPRPTDAELEILRVLWERGPSTVRQVHEELAARETGYTTTLKLMQIMAAKGLLDTTQRQLVNDLVQRAFGGSAAELVLRALASHKTSDSELREIRKLIDEAREERR